MTKAKYTLRGVNKGAIMILPNTQIILYKSTQPAWIAELKTVKQITVRYASTIKFYAYTTQAEAIAKAATSPVKEGMK